MKEKNTYDEKSLGRKNRRDTLIVIAVVVLLIAIAFILVKWVNPGYSRKPYQREERVLDDNVTITAYGKDQSQVEGAVDAAFQELYRIDAIANRYSPESEIASLNAEATAGPVVVSEDLWEMIATGMEVYKASGGLFDITIGPLSDLWDIKGRGGRGEPPPSDDEIRQAMELVGADMLVLNGADHSVYFSREGMVIDLGGLAKGYALDRAAEALSSMGIEAAVVDMISTSLVMGDKPGAAGGPMWEIAISDPRGGDYLSSGEYLGTLHLTGGTYSSTSGDYQRYFEYEGVRYHHIIDPRTGYPARGTISTTVVGGRGGAWSDAMSTTAFIMGDPGGLDWVTGVGDAEAIIVDSEGVVHTTPGMGRWVENLREKVDLGGSR